MLKFVITYYLINCMFFGHTSQFEVIDNAGVDESSSSGELMDTSKEGPVAVNCPNSVKEYSSEEIKDIVDYIYENEGLNKVISNNYEHHVTQVSREISTNLFAITSWIAREPSTLQNVLKGLQRMRKNVEPKVNAIDSIMRQFPYLEEELKSKLNQTQKSLNKVHNIDQICLVNNCSRHHLNHQIAKRNVNQENNCRPIDNIFELVRTKLVQAVNQLNKNINASLDNRRDYYFIIIDRIRQNVKQAVIKYFGVTMYNILKLQEDYMTFVNNLKYGEIKLSSQQLKEQLLTLKAKLSMFSRVIDEYRDYCIHCNDNKDSLLFSTRRSDSIINAKNNVTDIIDKVIKDKMEVVTTTIVHDISMRFLNYKKTMIELDNLDNYMHKLDPVTKEIANLTEQERDVLKQLENKAPSNAHLMFLSLLKDAVQTVKNIDDIVKRISP